MKNLIEKINSGDLSAFELLVKRHRNMAVAYAYSLTKDFQSAEDIAQEAFIQAFKDIGKLKKPGAFTSWFKTIIFSKWNRQVRRKKPLTVAYDENQINITDGKTSVDPIIKKETYKQLLHLINSLPEKERAVTSLFYIDGYNMEEVAKSLTIPVSTVKSRLYTARKKMQHKFIDMVGSVLQEFGQEPSAPKIAEKIGIPAENMKTT